MPGLANSLIGQKVGSRVLAGIAPRDGFGARRQHRARLRQGRRPDLRPRREVGQHPAEEGRPATRSPRRPACRPSRTTATARPRPSRWSPAPRLRRRPSPQPLIKGKGAAVKAGQTVTVNYVGQIFGSDEGLRLLVLPRHHRRLPGRHRRHDPRLRQGPDRPDRRQPRAAGHPAGRRLRQGRQRPGRHQGHRHPGVRRRHPRRATEPHRSLSTTRSDSLNERTRHGVRPQQARDRVPR